MLFAVPQSAIKSINTANSVCFSLDGMQIHFRLGAPENNLCPFQQIHPVQARTSVQKSEHCSVSANVFTLKQNDPAEVHINRAEDISETHATESASLHGL